ncbi:MAG: DNA-directed RNA polymerase subunit omega [Clostridiaceae bacterium]
MEKKSSDKKTMINPSIKDLLEKVDNRYRLVTVTSRRARQIVAKQEPLTDDGDSDKPLSTAIDEVNEGFIQYETIKDIAK